MSWSQRLSQSRFPEPLVNKYKESQEQHSFEQAQSCCLQTLQMPIPGYCDKSSPVAFTMVSSNVCFAYCDISKMKDCFLASLCTLKDQTIPGQKYSWTPVSFLLLCFNMISVGVLNIVIYRPSKSRYSSSKKVTFIRNFTKWLINVIAK